jgi:hypothetical protein
MGEAAAAQWQEKCRSGKVPSSARPARSTIMRATLSRAAGAAVLTALLVGCASQQPAEAPARRPDEVRAQIAAALPAGVPDRAGWAVDTYAAFASLGIDPSRENVCAALAVAGQESNFRVDPPVPNLPKIAWEEIDRRAERLGVPRLLVHAALKLSSPTGKTYEERIDAAKTEQDLSSLFEDLISSVPLGQRLFGGLNPVRTAGPMQVSIAFAERQVREKPYPYPMDGSSVRHEIFTRRGGLYFGIAHLLDYPAPYDRMLYRFADFNAGRYASRNAAFQSAVSQVTGIPLALDGDLVRRDGSDAPGSTELAVRTLGKRLDMGEGEIHRALLEGDDAGFERSALYRRVFELAERQEGRALPRAVVPRIDLQSPKITRKLTTEWFAEHVDARYRRCLAVPG